MEQATVTVCCRDCSSANRIPVERALLDLSAVRCGSCRAKMLRVSGEPLVEVTVDDLSHPWDREALDKLKAVPYADRILTRMFGATLDKLARFHLLASAVRISEQQAPRLWRMYLEAAGRVNVDPPPLFIIQTPIMNAYAMGAESPAVAVTTGLLDGSMKDQDVLGVLGHELTHVKLEHVLYRTLAILLLKGGTMLLDRFLGIGHLLAIPIRVALLKWYQMSELSADRGELITTGSMESFIRTHLVLSGGANRFIDEMDPGAFVEQAYEAEQMRDSELLVYLMDMLDDGLVRTHPLPAWRVNHGLKWAQTEAFFDILAGRPVEKIEGPGDDEDAEAEGE